MFEASPPHLPSSRTHTSTTTKVQTGLCCFFGSLSFDLNGRPMAERGDAGGGTGSARLHRERRLRSMLRHERMAVTMALAESLHHSARRPEKARAREVEEQDQHEALRRQKAPPQGMRPGVLQDPAPQGRVGQHSGIGCELVLALDVFVLQMAEQLVDASSLASSRRQRRTTWRWSTWSWSVQASPSPRPRSSG